jgi:hypothetical protein
MSMPDKLHITSTTQVSVLTVAAEVLLDIEMDQCRAMLKNSGAFVNMKEVNPHMRRAVAIQEVQQYLNHIITPASHSHPTIIPLTLIQAEVVQEMIEFAVDFADDTVTDPLFVPAGSTVTSDQLADMRKQLNECIDNLVAATELKACWQMAKYS